MWNGGERNSGDRSRWAACSWSHEFHMSIEKAFYISLYQPTAATVLPVIFHWAGTWRVTDG